MTMSHTSIINLPRLSILSRVRDRPVVAPLSWFMAMSSLLARKLSVTLERSRLMLRSLVWAKSSANPLRPLNLVSFLFRSHMLVKIRSSKANQKITYTMKHQPLRASAPSVVHSADSHSSLSEVTTLTTWVLVKSSAFLTRLSQWMQQSSTKPLYTVIHHSWGRLIKSLTLSTHTTLCK